MSAQGLRTRRLEVRLTTDEVAWIESRASARGLSVTNYVRSSALRGGSLSTTTGRRALSTDVAQTIRLLTAIAAGMQHLVVLAQSNVTIPQGDVRASLARLTSVISGLAT